MTTYLHSRPDLNNLLEGPERMTHGFALTTMTCHLPLPTPTCTAPESPAPLNPVLTVPSPPVLRHKHTPHLQVQVPSIRHVGLPNMMGYAGAQRLKAKLQRPVLKILKLWGKFLFEMFFWNTF